MLAKRLAQAPAGESKARTSWERTVCFIKREVRMARKHYSWAYHFVSFCFVAVLALFLLSSSALAAESSSEPGKRIKSTVESIQATLLQYRGKVSEEDLNKKLIDIVEPVFDFAEMSRRCLGANWQEGTASQRDEFVKLFSELLADNYLDKLKKSTDAGFEYAGESVRGENAVIRSIVSYQGDKASLDYRLQLKNGTWRIYDVIIENVGLVSNYRNEFSGIVRKEGFAGLLTRVRDKVSNKTVVAQ